MEIDSTVRVNIRVSRKIKEYFENKSKETGVSQSSLMALALEEYVVQRQTLEFMNNVDLNKLYDNYGKS